MNTKLKEFDELRVKLIKEIQQQAASYELCLRSSAVTAVRNLSDKDAVARAKVDLAAAEVSESMCQSACQSINAIHSVMHDEILRLINLAKNTIPLPPK